MATHRFGAPGGMSPEPEAGHEAEAERLFGRLAGLTQAPPALRRVALAAGRSVLNGLCALPAGPGPGFGSESAHELELEAEISPLARVYPDLSGAGGLDPMRRVYGGREALAMMEHLGHAAAEAVTEAEAESYLGALVPLAARLAPRVAPLIVRSAPGLIRGVSGAAAVLRSNPRLAPLVRTLPAIVRATVAQIVRQSVAAAAGRAPRLTPQGAVRTLARQAVRVIGSPPVSAQVWRRSVALDRLYHRANPATAVPSVRVVARCAGCGGVTARRCPCGCGGTRQSHCGCGCGCGCGRCRPRV